MIKYARYIIMMMVALTLAACGKDKEHLDVSPSQLEGLWVKAGTQEYWHYNADYTGVTWDASDDIGAQESNLTYTWSLQQDVITHVFTGAMANQAVPAVYTITAISHDEMRWEDDYGLAYTLYRTEEQSNKKR